MLRLAQESKQNIQMLDKGVKGKKSDYYMQLHGLEENQWAKATERDKLFTLSCVYFTWK